MAARVGHADQQPLVVDPAEPGETEPAVVGLQHRAQRLPAHQLAHHDQRAVAVVRQGRETLAVRRLAMSAISGNRAKCSSGRRDPATLPGAEAAAAGGAAISAAPPATPQVQVGSAAATRRIVFAIPRASQPPSPGLR
jgi:hypothetical protein